MPNYYDVCLKYEFANKKFITTKSQTIYSGALNAYRVIVSGGVGNEKFLCQFTNEITHDDGTTETLKSKLLEMIAIGVNEYALFIPNRIISIPGSMTLSISVKSADSYGEETIYTNAEIKLAVVNTHTEDVEALEFAADELVQIDAINETLSDIWAEIALIKNKFGE